VGTPSLEARNIRLVNIITYIKKDNFACTQVPKMAKFERKQQNYLYFSRRKTLQK
jgi:hypothetical protein